MTRPATPGQAVTGPSAADPGWRPTTALVRVTALPAVLAVLAVLLRRPDLVWVLAPLSAAAIWGLAHRLAPVPPVLLGCSDDAPLEGSPVTVGARVHLGVGADLVCLALPGMPWLRPDGAGAGTAVAAIAAPPPARRSAPEAAGVPGATEVGAELRAQRWGRHLVGPAQLTVLACGGLMRHGPQVLAPRLVRVLPLAADPGSGWDLLPARGGIGIHRSRRPGSGAEVSGVRAFHPGDRLRRINWRASLLTGDLHVNSALAEQDANVVLLLDARYAAAVDAGVRATAGLARLLLRQGDRIAVHCVGDVVRTVPAGAGRATLLRVLDVLLDVVPARIRVGEPPLPAPPRLGAGAVVVLVSPLAGRAAVTRAAVLARAGHPLLVVDTLPDADPTRAALPEGEGPWADVAWRWWRLERAARVHRLGDLGVAVVPWQGVRSLDPVLAALTRLVRAPRIPR